MFIRSRSRIIVPVARAERIAGALVLLLVCMSPPAPALQSDRSQPMSIDAHYQKSTLSRTGKAGDPDVLQYDGNVAIAQGSMKINANHATVYRNPSGVADANGDIGGITHIVFTGNPAHMRQVHDGDCRLTTAEADKIDFDNVTGIAKLTGNVTVVQKGKGEFRGQNMTYNTNTGDMESGSKAPDSRVHMVIQPRDKTPASKRSDNCGYPKAAGTSKTVKAGSGN